MQPAGEAAAGGVSALLASAAVLGGALALAVAAAAVAAVLWRRARRAEAALAGRDAEVATLRAEVRRLADEGATVRQEMHAWQDRARTANVAAAPARTADAPPPRPSAEFSPDPFPPPMPPTPAPSEPPAVRSGASDASSRAPSSAPSSASSSGATAGGFAAGDAARVLAAWCRAGRFPDEHAALDRAHVRLAGPVVLGGPPPRLLEETRQLGEFERVGLPDAAEAWLVPNPDARFTPIVSKLFPALDEDWEQQPSLYERVAPLRVVRREGATWEIAS